ncbi:peptide chain release factor N(5)-glutamine methyltransferase [Chitinophagaceae bacterium LWZ2-11]
MTIRAAYQQLSSDLSAIYESREAANIADWVIEHFTGLPRVDRIVYKDKELSPEQQNQLQKATQELLKHKPVQYVLREAWFGGMKFYVNENVLIPRPETDELIEWIITDFSSHQKTIQLLDIGSGSGCIPISLQKNLSQATVTSLDVSDGALEVARQNAITLKADVDFKLIDFLNEDNWNNLGMFDVIVSNPPYIKDSESATMHNNVLSFEPHLALFVDDNDALIFYRKIAAFAITHLAKDGKIYVEINEALGAETKALFESYGFTTELRKDLQGKDRMIRACVEL